jgi:hypothetical protein
MAIVQETINGQKTKELTQGSFSHHGRNFVILFAPQRAVEYFPRVAYGRKNKGYGAVRAGDRTGDDS